MTGSYLHDGSYDSALALVGMSGRFPGARDIETFWRNIAGGVQSIRFFSDEELLAAGVDPAMLQQPNFVKAGSLLEEIEQFDAAFFGYTPREAEIMDPQHRFFLECAWEALESAGYNTESEQGLIGIFAGSSFCSYLIRNLYADPKFMESVGTIQASIGNERDALTSTVSYKLNLKGPCAAVQTFCSTSLVAVHMACQSLLNYECDMALAGGVAIEVPHSGGYLYSEGGIVSPDGQCRTFDASAQGSVMGNGVGVVLLKRFRDALADGDHMYAIIRGSAMNNDGSHRVSITAPGLDGQTEVIAEALGNAGVATESIGYIEAHGTATELGDAVELAAMIKAFETQTGKKQFCAIGSVKPNVGHLDRAAGVTGLIKTALALKHKQLPPSLNYERTSSDIDLENSPFYVNTALHEWPHNGTPRRAGVSSFGLGGTNAHVILEEAPTLEPESLARPYHLLLLSAKTELALQKATANLATHLQQHPELSLPDVAHTLQVGRNVFSYRRMLVCQERDEAIAALQSLDARRVQTLHDPFRDRPVVFLLPGLGEQYPGMTQELYNLEPVFRAAVDQCCDYLKPLLQADLREILFPPGQAVPKPTIDHASRGPDMRTLLRRNGDASTTGAERLKQTAFAQPIVFVIEYALAQLLIQWGICPQAMLGYSVGEYVAACIADVLSLNDALMLVAERARLISGLPGGTMIAVALSEHAIQPYLNEHVSLAVINAPNTCVLAGTYVAIERLEAQLEQLEITHRRVETTHAFHSTMLEPLREALTALASNVAFNPPRIPYISNVTGTWITNEQVGDPGYWAQHMCQTVRFADGVAALLQKTESILLEVGPGQSLCSFVKQHPACERQRMPLVMSTLPSVYERSSEFSFLLNTLGKLWLSGVTLDWKGFYAHEKRRRVPLPTYPFERQRYWIEPPEQAQPTANTHASATTGPNDDLERIADVSQWFFAPGWKQVPSPALYADAHLLKTSQCWLVCVDACGIGWQVINQLAQYGQQVIAVQPGVAFARLGEDTYSVRPGIRADFDTLCATLLEEGKTPAQVVHFWTVSPVTDQQGDLEQSMKYGFYSLLALAQSLGDLGLEHCDITVVSNELQDVLGNEQICPEKAMIIGPCRVIPQEYSNLTCRSIDIVLPEHDSEEEALLLHWLVEELTSGATDAVVALRGNRRWIQSFELTPLPAQSNATSRLRHGGVYLITGGLGGIALAMADYLARTVQAKLVLVGRTGLPPRQQWEHVLTNRGETDGIGQQICKVLALEAQGSSVLIVKADVANEAQMREAVEQAVTTFDTLHGVLHAAGTPGIGLIQLKSPEQTEQVLAPKVQGTLVLERVLRDRPLDFLVLFSSMTSITGGGPGQVDYCAANAFLDAYARRNTAKHGLTVAIDWGEWQWNAWETGLVGYDIEAQAYFRAHRQTYGISFAEGTDALGRILSTRLPHVVVSTQDFRVVAERSKLFTVAAVLQHTRQSRKDSASYPRPDLASSYIAPGSNLERRITAIWEELLGITPVGIDDNFFELGGNSLTGIDLIVRLKKTLEAKTLAAHVIFEAPTVSTLASYIEKGKTELSVDEWQGRSEKRRAGLRQRIREAGRVL